MIYVLTIPFVLVYTFVFYNFFISFLQMMYSSQRKESLYIKKKGNTSVGMKFLLFLFLFFAYVDEEEQKDEKEGHVYKFPNSVVIS